MLNINSCKEILKRYYGYDNFRKNQLAPINSIVIDKKNLFIVLPTGGGKSILYTIPALLYGGLTVVVSPLIALMADQVFHLQQLGIKADYISSDKKNFEDIKKDIKNLKIIFISPERFVQKKFYEWIKNIDISLIALDEAHTFTQFGLKFRADYRKFFKILKEFKTQFIALTATASKTIYDDIIENYNFDKIYKFSVLRENLSIKIKTFLTNSDRDQNFFKVDFSGDDLKLIYTNSRAKTEKIYKQLGYKYDDMVYYHAKLDKTLKKQVLEGFLSDKYKTVIATTAFGMGIDKSDIRKIYNLGLPFTIEDYTQQIGRGGRDGKPAKTELWFSIEELIERAKYFDLRDLDNIFNIFLKKVKNGSIEMDNFFEKELFQLLKLNSLIKFHNSPIIKIDYIDKENVDLYPIMVNLFNFLDLGEFKLYDLSKKLNLDIAVILDILQYLNFKEIIKYNLEYYFLEKIDKSFLLEKLKSGIETQKKEFISILNFIFTTDCYHNYILNFYEDNKVKYRCNNRCANCLKPFDKNKKSLKKDRLDLFISKFNNFEDSIDGIKSFLINRGFITIKNGEIFLEEF